MKTFARRLATLACITITVGVAGGTTPAHAGCVDDFIGSTESPQLPTVSWTPPFNVAVHPEGTLAWEGRTQGDVVTLANCIV